MTDGQIVELFFERSERAIHETELAYGRYLHYIAYGILCDDGDSKEIVNDTYMKAWNTIPPARPDPLKAFLGRITRQLSINRLKTESRQKRGGGQYSRALDEISECIPDDDDRMDVADLVTLRDSLNSFLRSLPEETRSVFIRRYWHMSPISGIASDFSMSESKVKSMLKRTREKLKKYLTKEGFNL